MAVYTKPASSHPVELITYEFLSDLEGLRTAAHLTGRMMQSTSQKAANEYKQFLKDHCTETIEVDASDEDLKTLLTVDPTRIQEYQLLESQLGRTGRAARLVPRSFVVSMVSAYDVFLSKLVVAMFAIRPECLNQSERVLKVADLLQASSREELLMNMIDDEVETLLRKSHHDQFTWLENRFAVVLRKDLAVWPDFVEVTQRRNLFVHADGKMSKQYIDICKSEGAKVEENVAIGQRLGVNASYIEKTFATLLEIGVKLGQVLWRKHDQPQLRNADYALNELAVRLLDERKYELSKRLLDFSCETLKRHDSRETHLYFVVNRALAWKLSGDEKKCEQIIGAEDWSVSSVRFEIAVAALRDDLPKTLAIMRKNGDNGLIKATSYQLWPLFRKFRKDKEFTKTFEEIFKIPLEETKKIEPVEFEAPDPPQGLIQ